MKHEKNKEMFSLNNIFIYLLYFFIFLSIGGIVQASALLFERFTNYSMIYGIILSIFKLLETILPITSSYLSTKYNSRNVAIIGFIFAILGANLIILSNNIILLIISILMIYSSRTVFNFSFGNSIIFNIPNDSKAKFFAIRDIFLFGAISASLFVLGKLVIKFGIERSIQLITSFLIIAILVTFFIKIENSATVENKRNSINLNSLKRLLRNSNFKNLLIINIFSSLYSSISAFLPFLALSVGLDYNNILNLFGITIFLNSVIALLIGIKADQSDKKKYFIFDIISDLIPVFLYVISTNKYIFLTGIAISSLKDIFTPTTFAYKYELLEGEDQMIAIGTMESFVSLIGFAMPVIVGSLWIILGRYCFLIALFTILFSTYFAFKLETPQNKVSKE